MKVSITAIFCFLLLSSCFQPASNDLSRRSNFSTPDLPPNAEPGKCYAKSLMPDMIEETPMQIPVYVGAENDTKVKRGEKEYVLTQKSTAWVKKKADRNCLSPNPDDCLVWCLVEIPEEKISRMVVLDTSATSNYKMERIVFKEIQQKGGYTKWFEVLCEKEINETFVSDLHNKLFVHQFLEELPEVAEFSKQTKAALVAYQRDHGLPVGNLDFETLAHLGIDY